MTDDERKALERAQVVVPAAARDLHISGDADPQPLVTAFASDEAAFPPTRSHRLMSQQ
jgi:hypothetical protein